MTKRLISLLLLALLEGITFQNALASEVIESPFSDIPVNLRTFSISQWEDATKIQYRSANGNDNTIFIKYSEDEKSILLAFIAKDGTRQADDRIIIAVDKDHSRSQFPESEDVSIEFTHSAPPETYTGSERDWMQKTIEGLEWGVNHSEDSWIAMVKLPLPVSGPTTVGLYLAQKDGSLISALPQKAESENPRTWAELRVQRLTIHTDKDTLKYQEKLTVKGIIHPKTLTGNITIQHNIDEKWVNLKEARAINGTASIEFYPAHVGIILLRPVYTSGNGTRVVGSTKTISIEPAQSQVRVSASRPLIRTGDNVRVTVALSTPSSNGTIQIETLSGEQSTPKTLSRGTPKNGFYQTELQNATINTTLRASWTGDSNYLASQSEWIELLVLPPTTELIALETGLRNALEKATNLYADFITLDVAVRDMEKRLSETERKLDIMQSALEKSAGAEDQIAQFLPYLIVLASGAIIGALYLTRRKP